MSRYSQYLWHVEPLDEANRMLGLTGGRAKQTRNSIDNISGYYGQNPANAAINNVMRQQQQQKRYDPNAPASASQLERLRRAYS